MQPSATSCNLKQVANALYIGLSATLQPFCSFSCMRAREKVRTEPISILVQMFYDVPLK